MAKKWDEPKALRRLVNELKAAPLEARPRIMNYLWDRFMVHLSAEDVFEKPDESGAEPLPH